MASKHDNFGSKQEAEERKLSRDREQQDPIVKVVSDYYGHSRQDNIYTKDEDPPHLAQPASSNKDSKDRKPLHRVEPQPSAEAQPIKVEPLEQFRDIESIKSQGAFTMETQFILDLI
jgi:hypothetical protein